MAQIAPPGGDTPTALALRDAVADLQSLGFTDGTIVLVSDGESNCNEDPCDAAKEAAASGFQLTVNTVGFNISDAGKTELQCIANATEGTYTTVDDAAQLGHALAEASRPRLDMTLDYPTGQVPVTETDLSITATIVNPTGLPATTFARR